SFSEQTAGLKHNNQNYETRPQSIKIKQQAPIASHEQSIYTVPYTPNTMVTGRVPVQRAVKPGDFNTYSLPPLQTIYMAKEGSAAQAEQKVVQLVQKVLLWQVIKGQEAQNQPGSNWESIINQYPAQIQKKSLKRQQKFITQSSSKETNTPLLVGRVQVRSVEPFKKHYDRLQSLVNQEAAKANIALTFREKQDLRSRQLNRNYPVNQWGFKEQPDLTASIIGKTRNRSDILSLMIYLKPSIFKQYMMGRQTARALSDYPLKAKILNSSREKLAARLIRESIKEQSSLKPWAGTNESRARQSSVQSPLRAGIMPDKLSYPGSSGREIGFAAQTGISNYLNINPYLYLTPQYRRRAESGREREIARYIENRMPFSEQTTGLKRDNRNYETRSQTIKIKQQAPIVSHEQSIYTVPYNPNTKVTGRVPVQRAVKPGDFTIYSLPPLQTIYMAKEGSAAQAEQKIVQLVQKVLLWKVIKGQEAQNQPGSNGEIRINHFPAPVQKKSLNRQQKLITQSRSKEANKPLLVGRVQVRGVEPFKIHYDRLQSLVNHEAAKANIALTFREKQDLRSRQLHGNYPVYQWGFKEQPAQAAPDGRETSSQKNILGLPVYSKTKNKRQKTMMRKDIKAESKAKRSLAFDIAISHRSKEFGFAAMSKQMKQKRNSDTQASALTSDINLRLLQTTLGNDESEYTSSLPRSIFKDKENLKPKNAYMKLASDLSLNYKQDNHRASRTESASVQKQEITKSIDTAFNQEKSSKSGLPVSKQEIKRIADQVFQEIEQKIRHERQRRGLPV
ncbi:MAG: hypothetical protein PHC92_11245, partial [Syntrophomonadaceae bacterium]|nr:hypothetical protein [Syntrophomonadaceae bacterium]